MPAKARAVNTVFVETAPDGINVRGPTGISLDFPLGEINLIAARVQISAQDSARVLHAHGPGAGFIVPGVIGDHGEHVRCVVFRHAAEVQNATCSPQRCVPRVASDVLSVQVGTPTSSRSALNRDAR